MDREAHHCHWTGCTKTCPPKMWGCAPHWYALPLKIRNAIWAAYRPGQEITKNITERYLRVALAAQLWIVEQRKALGLDSEQQALREAYLREKLELNQGEEALDAVSTR